MFSYSKRTLLIRHQKTIFRKMILWTDITQLKELSLCFIFDKAIIINILWGIRISSILIQRYNENNTIFNKTLYIESQLYTCVI